MTNVYQIVDSFLPEKEFKAIVDVITNGRFGWYSKDEGVGYPDDFSDKYFTHIFYGDGKPNSDYFDVLSPIIKKIEAKALLRAKANLYTRNTKLIEHGSHVDFEFEHTAFILYLNTNDGFTRLSDGTVVNSVANRALFFNGSKLHNSTNCTDTLARINISINYL
jgi:hypothetical protein